MFVGRQAEIAQLEKHYASGKAEMFVLYGRRRIGKSTLLRQFCAQKPHAFYVATESTDAEELAAFSQAILQYQSGQEVRAFTYPSWEDALRMLAELPGRPLVVMDEFTYLFRANSALPSILQKVWDETLSRSRVFLVLCGSYVGMIERQVLDYRAPLYGRRTGELYLPPLPVTCLPAFFPRYDALQQMEAWGVPGGAPYYLAEFSDDQDVFTNIREQILATNGLLRHEPLITLREEVRETRSYKAVLTAVAEGHTRLNDIVQHSRLPDASTAVRYLDLLQEMRIIRREVPVTEEQPEKSRKGIYQVADHFMRFWFRYVRPYESTLLAADRPQMVLDQHVRPTFDTYMGPILEEAAEAFVWRLADSGQLPFLPERVGRWWGGKDDSGRDVEIDVVALSDRAGAILVGECKWSRNPVGPGVLSALRLHKLPALDARRRWPHVYYALFAREGFTPELAEIAQASGIHLVTAASLLQTLTAAS